MPVDLLVEQVGGDGISKPVYVLLGKAVAFKGVCKGFRRVGEPAVNELARDELRTGHLFDAAIRFAQASGLEGLYDFIHIHGDAQVVWVVIDGFLGGRYARQDGGFFMGGWRWKKGVESLAAAWQVLRQADSAAVGKEA